MRVAKVKKNYAYTAQQFYNGKIHSSVNSNIDTIISKTHVTKRTLSCPRPLVELPGGIPLAQDGR